MSTNNVSTRPFCHSSPEPKSQIFGNFSSNWQQSNWRSWKAYEEDTWRGLGWHFYYIIARPKCLLIGEPVRGVKNVPIGLLHCMCNNELSYVLYSIYVSTMRLKSICPLASVWGKTPLNTGSVGGADPQTWKMGSSFVMSLVRIPIYSNF